MQNSMIYKGLDRVSNVRCGNRINGRKFEPVPADRRLKDSGRSFDKSSVAYLVSYFYIGLSFVFQLFSALTSLIEKFSLSYQIIFYRF